MNFATLTAIGRKNAFDAAIVALHEYIAASGTDRHGVREMVRRVEVAALRLHDAQHDKSEEGRRIVEDWML